MFSTHQRIGDNSSTDTGKKTVNDSNDGGGGGKSVYGTLVVLVLVEPHIKGGRWDTMNQFYYL